MHDVDVIVVGAGAGGPVAARVLSEAGVRVLMLDAGPWLDPEHDYSQHENDMMAMSDGKMRWGPADRDRDPWQRQRIGVGALIQSAGVGGSTRHYNGIASRAYASSINGEWPLAYEDLIEGYEAIERLLPVGRVRALAPKDALFAQGCRRLRSQSASPPTSPLTHGDTATTRSCRSPTRRTTRVAPSAATA